MNTEQNSQPPASEGSSFSGMGGLIAIIVGILLGVLTGVLFGHTMWVSTGGPVAELELLKKTKEQKARFAEEADQQAQAENGAAADRLRSRADDLRADIPLVEARIAELEKLHAQHQQKMGENGAATDAGYINSMWFAGTAAKLIEFAGDIFLQMLKLLVVPLVVTSMICGVTSLGDVRKMGRMGGTTIFYYFCTTAVAVLIGMALVLLIRPGEAADDTFAFVKQNVEEKRDTTVLETMLDVFRGKEGKEGSGMFPPNLFQAAATTNVLGLIVFSILFAGLLTTIGPKGRSAIEFFDAANEVIMKMVHLVMYLAPIGIFGLVAWNIAKNGGGAAFGEQLARIGWYVATVLLGLGLHAVALGFGLWVLTKRNPFQYAFGLSRSLLTAMSTASSSASLPVTMECVEENNGVSRRSASFVLPLGATVNMDGTALYEAVAVVFIAQSLGMTLSIGKLLVITLTATLAAVGAAGIPEAGLVTMVIVLSAAGVPMEGIGAILAIDWFLDRMRTTVNVFGDAIGAGVIDSIVPQEEEEVSTDQ